MAKKLIVIVGVLVVLALSAAAIYAQNTPDTTTTGAWLGVAIVEQDGQVVIARVHSGSPADAADLLINDVIVSFNGTAISSSADLISQVQAATPGDTATLEVQRFGETVSIEVRLGSPPIDDGRGGRGGRGMGMGDGPMGGMFMMPGDSLTLAEHLVGADLEAAEGGYEVIAVSRRNPFGVEVGDVLTTLNGQAITELDPQAFMEGMMQAEQPTLTLEVLRGGETVTLESDMFGMFGGHGGRDGRGGPGNGMGQPNTPSQGTVPELPATGNL